MTAGTNLFASARGHVGPPRLANPEQVANPDQTANPDQAANPANANAAEAISDAAFLRDLEQGRWLIAAEENIPFVCMDGRPSGTHLLAGPRSAGATIGLWAARILAGEDSAEPSVKSLQDFTADAAASGQPVGSHRAQVPLDDPAAHNGKSGCGAADHLAQIMQLIAEEGPTIRAFLTRWGLDAGQLDDTMRAQATQFAELSESIPGSALVDTVSELGEAPALVGAHQEQAAVVNLRPATTTAGTPQQVFHVDAWSFNEAGQAVGADNPARFAAALGAFNAAALLLLSSKEMPYVEIR